MAQLELSVVLNLANFRTQLGKLAQASAAYYYPINLTIDKQAFKKQLTALGNIKPVIKIDDSQLDAARARISTLNKSLATLRRATSTAIEIKVKYKEEGRPAAGTGAVGRAITGRAGGEEALANKSRGELQKLYGLFREANLRVGELSKSLGKSSAEEIRQSLVPAFSDSGEEAVNGLAIGLKDHSSKVSKAAKRLTVITIQDVKKGFGIASPSRVFKEIGKDLVAGLEIGFEDFNELRAKMVGKMRELVAVMRMEAAKIQDIPMTPGMSRSAGSRGSRQYMSPIGPLPEGSQEPWAFSQYRYQPFMAQPGQTRGAGVPPMRQRFPFLPEPPVMGTTVSSPGMYGASFPALPPAGGTAATRETMLAMRELEARARSAARAASIFAEDMVSAGRRNVLPPAGGGGGTAIVPHRSFVGPTSRQAIPMGAGGGALVPYRGGGGGGGRGPGGGGVVPPGGFPVDGVAVTRNAKLGTVMDVAAASTRNFTASQIPLIGGLKNLAGEFSQAAKQVLLYGTAYKGLAFLTSLPGQILNAAKSQQQFANGLKVATQDTGTFAKELLYVDNVQRAFGLNLETTRTGFTRLYASMAPTGFDSGSIEKLFTGISAATASLQLTPDKAERVIYAFGQMASKGQIMSEELKGQLGDVLPGALAIFSKAAGMSVKEFSKAMEDGEFTGNRFREVFAKVSDELMNRFGTGAQAAGRSLQGLINTVGGDFTRTLESFAPLANAAAQATLGPLTGMLREVSTAAQIAMGEQDRVRKQLEAAQTDVSTLKTGGANASEIKAAEQNVAALAARYEVLNEAAKDPAIAQQVKNIEAFVIEIQKAATFTMNLAGVIGNVLSPLFTLLGGNLTSVIGNLALLVLGFNAAKLAALLFMGVVNTMQAITGMTRGAAASATLLAAAYRALGIQITGVQVATLGAQGATTAFGLAIKGLLISTGIGAVIVLLGSLATAFLSVGNKAKEAADRAKRSIDSMVDAARTGNVSLIENELALNKADRQDLENFIKDVEGVTGKKSLARGGGTVETITLTPAQRREAKRLGAEIGEVVIKESLLSSLKGQRAPLKEVETEGKDELALARRRVEQLGLNQPTPGATTPEDPSTGKPLKEQSLESYYSLQDQLAKAQTQADIDRIEALFNHRKELINNLYDLEETRANSIQKEAIAHQRAISNIFLDLQKKQIDARLSVMKAEGSVAGGAPTGSGGSLAGMTQYITGDPSHPSYKPDHGTIENYHDHLAFASREAAIEAYNKLTKSGIQVTEFQGFGQGVTGPHSGPGSAHHQGLAMDVRGAQWGGSGAIGEREFAGSARVRATLGMGGSVGATPGKVTPDTKRDVLAEQAKLLAGKQAAISLTHAEVEAQQKLVIETEKYLAQIFGIAEKELQTSMLQKKTAMLRAGATDQEIEDAMSLEEINLKYTAGVDAANKQITTNNKLIAEGSGDKDLLNKNTAAQVRLIGKLNEELPKAIKAQTDLNEAQKDAPFLQRIRDLKEEIKLLLIVNDAERRLAELRNEYNGDAAKARQVFNLEEVKKNIEATRALISDFVSGTASDYKGFLKAVISGEDAVDALKQFQAGLKDKVLTIFLDFAMAPVEKFFKESLGNLFLPKAENIPGLDVAKEVTKDPVQATNSNTNATNTNTTELKNLTTAIQGMGAGTNAAPSVQGPTAGNAFSDGSALPPIAPGFDAASVFGNPEALTSAFGGVQASISESMNGIVSSFENGASSLGNALPAWDTALAANIPDALKTSTNETNKAVPTFQESLGKVTAGIGIAAGAIMGIAAGISQIKEGGTSNVLGGIGSVLMSLGGAVGGFAGFFKGANGGVASGGWKPFPVRAFANGGMVNGPTLGLVGEGKYNEAIVPLPDGRSIPVQMKGGGGGLREAMSGSNGRASGSPILNMSFQSTNINGVEYVSRDQLEAAMAQTRKQASRDGANRGMSMTLDKLQQSPQTRNRLGMR